MGDSAIMPSPLRRAKAHSASPQEATVATLKTAAFSELLEALTALSLRAGAAIRKADLSGGPRNKADGSPVTAADEAAEAVISEGLAQLAPSIPVISEEHASLAGPVQPFGANGCYFLVDPLDGTHEFIAGRDEYTVNIAVIANNTPILGVIAAPALGRVWRGLVGQGAQRIAISGGSRSPPDAIHTRQRSKHEPIIMLSRSHLEAATRAYVGRFTDAKLVQCGSSIKFCRLAEGTADLYPRLAPTREWDVAAGHAILTAAGGHVTAPDGAPLVYGTGQMVIPAFVANGDPEAP
jgi:3'(2'), 5'-bisphosphate nucleotidase